MKVLVVTECSEVNTGYGVVGKNLIRTLIDEGHEVVELALFIEPDDPKLKNIKWPYIVNSPSGEERDEFNSNRFNLEGMWSFDKSLLEIKPDVVIDIRDPYSYQYQAYSPFREHFNWIVFAPVDGVEQPLQWRETFRKADGLFTISKWGQNVIENYGITVDGTVYHSACEGFYEMPKEEINKIKNSIGIGDSKVIGTVMRNQPRKLFPSLFKGFSEYLDTTGDDCYLYCHTRYPDGGWNIPQLLMEHNISSKVFFTYFCASCKKSHSSLYKDLIAQCPFCKVFDCKLGCIYDGISTETMNIIYNLFDVYIQLACREGFGIPQIEAAATDRTIVTVDYAGMSDVGRKLNAIMIEPDSITHTHGMQMYEAAIEPHTVAAAIKKAFDNPRSSYKHFKKNFGSWKENFKPLINKIKTLNKKKPWDAEGDIRPIPAYQELNCSNSEYVKYLYYNVLQKPEWFGDYSSTRMISELGYKASFGGTHGFYFIEPPNCSQTMGFDRKAAYEICKMYRENINNWEQRRVSYD
jgi:hypothetical protein